MLITLFGPPLWRPSFCAPKFDCGAEALPLEGVICGGDSGGPVLIRHGSQWQLAGLTQGLYGHMADLSAFRAGTFRQGLCGQDFSSSRISHYASWIDGVIASPTRTVH